MSGGSEPRTPRGGPLDVIGETERAINQTQGLEARSPDSVTKYSYDTGQQRRTGAQARAYEQRVLAAHPELSEEDVLVQLGETGLYAELTGAGREKRFRKYQNQIRDIHEGTGLGTPRALAQTKYNDTLATIRQAREGTGLGTPEDRAQAAYNDELTGERQTNRQETGSGLVQALEIYGETQSGYGNELPGPFIQYPGGAVSLDIGAVLDDVKQSKTGVTPHVGMVAGEEGIEARGSREEVFASRAESGFENLLTGNIPSLEELGAIEFQVGEVAERTLINTGEDIREGSPTQGKGPVVLGDPLGSYPGDIVGGLFGVGGSTVGSVTQFPVTASADLNVPGIHSPDTETLTDEGLTPTQASGGEANLLKTGGENFIRGATEHLGETLVLFSLPAAETAVGFGRGYLGEFGASRTVALESISDAHGARGGVSRFKTSPKEPTESAVAEMRARAAEQPDAVKQSADAESVLYHTTGEKFPGEVTVGEGASELPGLWTAADVNAVGLRNTAFGRGALTDRLPGLSDIFRPRKPDFLRGTDRIAAFEGDRIAGMPETAQGAAYEVRGPTGEALVRGLSRGEAKKLASTMEEAVVAPDTTTGGYQFLTSEAEPGTAYVRPTGSRTPELEAIFPPESEFIETVGGPRVNVAIGAREVNIPESISLGGKEFNVPGGGRTLHIGGERLPLDTFVRKEAPEAELLAAGEGTDSGVIETVGGYNSGRDIRILWVYAPERDARLIVSRRWWRAIQRPCFRPGQ